MFLIDPEKAHKATLDLFSVASSIPGLKEFLQYQFKQPKDDNLKRELWGLTFPNPVGLAAGFDKDGKYYKFMAELGFGFIEIGTVTPRPQSGNSYPRLFRLKKDKALINRMGFNNDGVDAMCVRLESRDSGNYVLGANIGKNKDTPNEKAVDDYLTCFSKLHTLVDYFVVNVSSPNTPGLRELQQEKPLTRILTTLQDKNMKIPESRPILLKISPDLSEEQLEIIIRIVNEIELDGIIATNTTTDRTGLLTPQKKLKKIGNGGLSGAPLSATSLSFLKTIKQNTSVPIISVGGIHNSQEAQLRLQEGADLVQVYTGLIYQGPKLIQQINKQIC